MKKISLWTLIVFALTTVLTMQCEAPQDGINKFGYPLTFFDHFAGKCDDCYHVYGFTFSNLLIDLGLTTLLVAVILFTVKRFSNKNTGA